jgi:hypothetical protein
MSSMMAGRTVGKLGSRGGPLILFSGPLVRDGGAGERVSDYGHERMSMEVLPVSSFEVIEPEFFLQLLMSLLAKPPRFDRGS